MVHGTAGALGSPRTAEFGNDLVDRARLRRHRKRNVGVAQRAVAFAVIGEIKRDDRYALAPRIGPDVALGPMQDRMNPQMGASRQPSVEVIPEFRRLVAHVPTALQAPRREHPLLRAGRFLVTANTREQAVETVLGKGKLQPLGLAGGGTGGWRQRGVNGLDRRAGFDE